MLAKFPAREEDPHDIRLTDILVRQFMIQADSLWLVFDRLSIHDGVLELVDNGLVDLVTAAKRVRVVYLTRRVTLTSLRLYQPWTVARLVPCNQAFCLGQSVSCSLHGSCQHTLRFSVYTSKVQLFPHHLQQFIDVPAMFGADRACVRYAVEKVKLFDCNGVDLVQSIDHRYVCSALLFQYVDNIVDGGIAANCNVCTCNAVL